MESLRDTDLFLVLTTPTDGDLAAAVLVAAAEDLYWLDTPPEEDGEWMIPNLVTDPRVIGDDAAFVMIDAGKADPELLTRIPGIVGRHLEAIGGADGVLSLAEDLGMESGRPFVAKSPSTRRPRPAKPASATRPRIPPRPATAVALDRVLWDQRAFLAVENALRFTATEVAEPLLSALGDDAPLGAVAPSELDEGSVAGLRALAAVVDPVLVRLPVHEPTEPESRDPLIWSGVDSALTAAAEHWVAGQPSTLAIRILYQHGQRPDALEAAYAFALKVQAIDLLNSAGFRTWGRWIGQAARRLASGDQRAGMRAKSQAQRLAIREVFQWLVDDPAEDKPSSRGLLNHVREAAHAAVLPVLAGQRDAARHRAAHLAALVAVAEVARRAAERDQ